MTLSSRAAVRIVRPYRLTGLTSAETWWTGHRPHRTNSRMAMLNFLPGSVVACAADEKADVAVPAAAARNEIIAYDRAAAAVIMR